MGHGVPMARVRGAERFDALRARWHHASLKTSFMVYMLGFLLLALVMSTVTAGMFSGLQHRVIADAYEISGLYLYDAHNRTLVPARAVDIDENGSSVFVQTVRGEMTEMPLTDLSSLVEITDASDYQYSPGTAYLYGSANDDALSVETPEAPDQAKLTPAELPAYDAKARDRFDAWLAANPDSPYTSFFDGDSQDGNTVGLLTSAVGYYVNTPPSEEAQALSSALELLTFLMFPLWFGLCIFAAARRFFGKRLQPGFDVLDRAASNIAEQNLEFSVSYDRDDELGHLASSFEAMRASLAESQRALWRTAEERKRLNAAFAHDLRTPLTILKGKVELLEAHLQAGDASPEQLASSAASLAAQVERLERYVAAMSGLQKLEDRAVRPDAQPFDAVADAVEDIGRSLCAQAGGTRTTVEVSEAPAGNRGTGLHVAFALSISARCNVERPVLGVDRSLVEEVAENLVGNAARFADGRVDARLDVRDGFLVLAVEDDGPGFSPAALERGCAPFFSETPSKDHFGLGLNIAALLCDKHGGDLALENRAEGGARATARFALIFPAVDSQ